MAQAKKAEDKDIVEFMNAVLSDLQKMEKGLEKLTTIVERNQNALENLEARIQVIESIPLLATHIRTQNASPAN